jgi:hypothetical protein
VQLFADHINNLAAHLEKRGRRGIMWGDALLERSEWPAGFAATTAAVLRKLVSADGQFERAGWNTFELPAEVD